MNIVQAYTKFKKQNIIVVSGFSGSGKTKLSKFLSDLFGFQHINLTRFYLPKEIYDKDVNYVTLKDGYKVLNWDNVYSSIDWDKLNDFVNDNKDKGVVLVGFGFPKSLLTFEPDFHIHIKINKKNLIENREAFIEKHATDFYHGKEAGETEYQKAFDRDKAILNNITYPIYLKLTEDSKIDKFINANELSEDGIKEDVFSYLMSMIDRWLKNNVQSKSDADDGKRAEHEHERAKKPLVHYEGNPNSYDEFYYPNKKRVLYDFNDEGDEYPAEYIKKFGADKGEDSSSSLSSDSEIELSKKPLKKSHKKTKKHLSESDSSTDATFLFTTDGRELNEDD